jgi:hypothetical protein
MRMISIGSNGAFAVAFRKNVELGADPNLALPRREATKRIIKPVPVLLKQPTKQWTRFYVSQASGRSSEMTWGRFQQLLKEIGYPRQIKAGSVQLVDLDIADTISRKWNSAAKQ